MISSLLYFCFPSLCFHCEELLMNNGGLCRACFSQLSLLDAQEKKEECHGSIFERGALFPAIDPLESLLLRTLMEQHEKMIRFFSALLVIQASFLDLPWCTHLFFVPGSHLKKRLMNAWHEELSCFFQVPIIRDSGEELPCHQTIYLIDWYLKPDSAYDEIIEELSSLFPHTFVLLSIFDTKPSNGIRQIRG